MGRLLFLALFLCASTVVHAFELQGTGVHRQDEESCLKSLPALGKRLATLGIQGAHMSCQPVDGEPEAFEPVFKSSNVNRELAAETAVSVPLSSRSRCEANLQALLTGVADADEKIVESGCVLLTVVDPETDESTENFQAMVVLIK